VKKLSTLIFTIANDLFCPISDDAKRCDARIEAIPCDPWLHSQSGLRRLADVTCDALEIVPIIISPCPDPDASLGRICSGMSKPIRKVNGQAADVRLQMHPQ
jgi:hypothetical protein